MRVFLTTIAVLASLMVKAQSDLIIRASDTLQIMVNLDGKKYDMDGASVIKITDIPDKALVNVTIMLESSAPKVYFQRHEFKGEYEWDFKLEVPEKKNVLLLEELNKTEKNDDFEPAELGENYVTYRFGKYMTSQNRFRGTVDAASSLSFKRTKEKNPESIKIEDGVETKEESSRTQTVKKQGSSTVIRQERKTTADGDNRETTILKPRKESCDEAWDKADRKEQLALLSQEMNDPGKLYISKKIAIAHCMEVKDAIVILDRYDNEATLIEMTKFIYPSIVDPENFENIRALFKSTASWEAVNLYIDVKYNR